MESIQLTPLDKNQSLLQRIFVFFLGVLFHIYIIIEKIRGVRKDPKRVKQSDCIFCKCQSNEYQQKVAEPQQLNKIVYKDELCFIIKDMKPRSEFHYLVIPKEHIGSIDNLSTSEHLQLLEHMRQVGIKSVAEQIRSKNVSLDRHPLLVAFHVPPFYTIDHLHMHILSSSTFVNKKASFYFQNPSMWCLHYDTVIEQVQQRMNQQKKEE